MADKPQGIHGKLAQVMFEAERIPKNGVYDGPGRFRFVEAGDAADVIRKALATLNVSMTPTAIELVDQTEHTTSKGTSMTTVTVRTTWTLTDADTGESTVIQSMGSGADAGDKAVPKAQTNAMKYALLMGFLLSTGDDPELHDTSDRRPRTSLDGQTGAAAPPAAPVPSLDEVLVSVGVITRSGLVAKGKGQNSDLEWREQPDGYKLGFLLEVGDNKPRPQVAIEGTLGQALFAATSMDTPSLEGKAIEVEGEAFEVHVVGRRMFYRIVAARVKTDEWEIPAAVAPGQLALVQ